MRKIPERVQQVQVQAAAAREGDAISDHAGYKARANENAPKTAATIREAAQGLIDEGHSEHGAAAILGIEVAALRRLIGCMDCER